MPVEHCFNMKINSLDTTFNIVSKSLICQHLLYPLEAALVQKKCYNLFISLATSDIMGVFDWAFLLHDSLRKTLKLCVSCFTILSVKP